MNTNKGILGILLIATILIASTGMAAALQDPYPMDGYVVYKSGSPVDNANITFTNLNTCEIIYKNSLSVGYYGQDAGNFASGYTDGDVIQYYTVLGDYSNTTIITIDVAAGFCFMDIIISETIIDVQAPTNLQSTTGNFYVHHSWTAGDYTDSYNVSINGVWHNATANTYYNDDGLAAHGWSNITVAGYNTSTGNTSASISANVQIPNNPITITNTGSWSGEVGETVTVDFNAVDADSDTPVFTCDRMDRFTDFDSATGTGNWTLPTAGMFTTVFSVSDEHGSTDSYSMSMGTGLMFDGVVNLIDAIVPLFDSILDLIIAIFPLIIAMAFLGGLGVLIKSIFDKVTKLK